MWRSKAYVAWSAGSNAQAIDWLDKAVRSGKLDAEMLAGERLNLAKLNLGERRYAAAERDNDVAAREIVFRKRFVNLHDGGKLLLRLAGFKDELRRVDTRFFKRSF